MTKKKIITRFERLLMKQYAEELNTFYLSSEDEDFSLNMIEAS